MTPADTLLGDVCGNDPRRVAAALQAAHGRSDELVPGIITRLEAVLAAPTAWSGSPAVNPSFLLFLAAEFRAGATHNLITRIFRLGDPVVYDLLGDVITEHGSVLLADTYPGSPEALIALVQDPTAGPFERAAGLQALAILWHRGHYPRRDLLALMLDLASGLNPTAEDDAMVGNSLVEVAVAIHATEIRDPILGLYERGLAEESFFDREYTENALRGEAAPRQQADELDETITNAWDAVEKWDFFRINDVKTAPMLPSAATSSLQRAPRPLLAPPKPGRNDPCPCGSGKKFKKCCGA